VTVAGAGVTDTAAGMGAGLAGAAGGMKAAECGSEDNWV